MNYQYAINVDKLELTYTTSEDMKTFLDAIENKNTYFGENREIWLERTDPRMYKNNFTIWCKDWSEGRGIYKRILAYMRFGSYNKFRQNVYVSYENEALYSDMLLAARYYIEEVLNFEFKQVSKLDIAVDFNFNIQRKLIQLYKDTSYDLIINGQVADNDAVRNVGFLSWGNPRHRLYANPQMLVANSNKKLTFKNYDKAKEIKDSSPHKHYIQERNGFHTKMYRMEISCKDHKHLQKSLIPLGLSDTDLYVGLDNEDILIRLFSHLLDRVIRLRKGRKSFNILSEIIKEMKC